MVFLYYSSLYLHRSDRPGLDPLLDVWNIGNSVHQVGNLGESTEDTLVREITDVHEGVEVCPSEVVSYKILAAPTVQLLLQLPQSCRHGLLIKLFQTSFILGQVQFHKTIDQILDGIHSLIHLS